MLRISTPVRQGEHNYLKKTGGSKDVVCCDGAKRGEFAVVQVIHIPVFIVINHVAPGGRKWQMTLYMEIEHSET